MGNLTWIHEISQSALAAAVLTLGLVILLELRSIARLRRSVDKHLQRVFEQLDLLRFESQQQSQPLAPAPAPRVRPPEPPIADARRPVAAMPTPTPTLPAARAAAAPRPPSAASSADELVGRHGLGAGEAKLLATLAAARARLGQPAGQRS
jgi:hypothetical protein